MSLLMDALKQAEHAKRGKPAEPPTTPPAADTVDTARAELSLAPADAPPRLQPAETITLAPAAEPVAPERVPVPIEAAAQTPAPDVPGAQTAARILAASAARHSAAWRRTALGLTGLTTVLALAIGAYYYYAALAQPQRYLSLPPLPAADAGPTADAIDADLALSIAEAPVDSPAMPQTVDETSPQVQTPWREGPPPAATATADDWQPAPVDPRVLRGERHDAAAEPPAQDPALEPVIRITRGIRPDRVHSALQVAYENYTAGHWAQAERAYRDALADEPGNRDAHFGLAALALRAGAPDTARMHYRELLRRNPKDAGAYAALAELDGHRDADSVSELKLRLAEQPQSAQLHFTLGNLYAAQQRWPQAQQAYFEAQRLALDNPDYAFNLAVSLEHIGQPRLAVDYYRRALQLRARHTGQFDPDAARQRIALLAAAEQP